MTLLSALWAKFAGWIAAAGAVVLAIGGIYLKGKSDERQKSKLEDITNANEIRKAGAAARAGADPSIMRDDGWKRD